MRDFARYGNIPLHPLGNVGRGRRSGRRRRTARQPGQVCSKQQDLQSRQCWPDAQPEVGLQGALIALGQAAADVAESAARGAKLLIERIGERHQRLRVTASGLDFAREVFEPIRHCIDSRLRRSEPIAPRRDCRSEGCSPKRRRISPLAADTHGDGEQGPDPCAATPRGKGEKQRRRGR